MSRLPTVEVGRELTAPARSLAPSSTSQRAAVLGGYGPRTFPPGDRSVLIRVMAHGWDLRASRCRVARAAASRPVQPASELRGIADSRSSEKTTGVGGEQRGCDGNKKIRGRKRHLLVDTARVSYSRQSSGAPRSWIETLLRQADTAFARPNIHGWVPDTERR